MKLIVEQVEYKKDIHGELIDKIEAEYDLINQLKTKHLLLGQVTGDDKLLGIFIFHIESLWNGDKEFVFSHVISDKTKSSNFTALVLPFVLQLAKQNEIKSLRIHTTETAVQKLYEKHGFKYEETVLTMKVPE